MKYFIPVLLLASLSANAQVTSATFGMMEARHLGPGTMSGRITAIQGSNQDGRTLYIGCAGGGVWKSTNAGASFKSVFDKYCQSIGAIAIDQNNPSTVFVGTGESNMRNTVSIGNGLYLSNDGGDNWKKVGLDSTEHIAKIIIDPKNSSNIYVAVPGPLWSDSKNRGLYKSIDGGKTWNNIFYVNEKTGCADIAVDPNNPDIVFASMWEFRRYPYAFNSGGMSSGMYKSRDGGKTWKEITTGLPPKPFGRIAFAMAPSAPNNMLAIVEAAATGLYISDDEGDTWKKQSATANVEARPFYFSVIQIDPKDPKRVYRPAYEFSYSSDGGYSFASSSGEGGWLHSDMHALWINPKNTDQMYVGTDGGVYVSLDRGATWMFLSNLPVGQFYHVAYDNERPYNIMGGLQDNGSWIAPSATPGGVNNGSWKAVYGGDGFWVQPDPIDHNTIYAESQGGNIGRIDKTTFKSVDIQPQQNTGEEKLRWNWNTPIVVGSLSKSIYMGAQYLYNSTNQGRSWKRISPDLTTNDKKKQKQEESGGISADNTSAENHCTIFTVTESPLDAKTIWVGTDDGNLQYTTNGGASWTNVAKNYSAAGIPAQTWVSSIELSRFDRNRVYATFDNHMYGDHKTYAAVSNDMGKTWKRFTDPEFAGFAHKLKEDLVNKDLLFLGTEMGLFGSVDGGSSWFRMKNHIPDNAMVRDIQINPVTNDLILATYGRGIMIVDNISSMRSLTKEILDKDVTVFENKPIPLSNGMYGQGGFPDTGGWDAGNPSSIPPIQYYLKDRASSGEVRVDIYDANNNLVQSMPGSKRKGINMVYWNLRMTPPKVATGGAKMDYGGFIAPMVLPGTYTMKLTIGDKQYTSQLHLVHDESNKSFTLADRELQYKTAMDLYHLHENLAVLVSDISEKQKTIKEAIANTTNPKAASFLKEYNTKLETLRATLLGTTQTSIFADEERLREKITKVYGSVANQEAAPSNLQLANVEVLKNDYTTAKKSFGDINEKYYNKAKEMIEQQKKQDIKPKLEKEEKKG